MLNALLEAIEEAVGVCLNNKDAEGKELTEEQLTELAKQYNFLQISYK